MVWAKGGKKRKKRGGKLFLRKGNRIEEKRGKTFHALDTGMRARRKHREAHLISSPYFSFLRNFPCQNVPFSFALRWPERDSLGLTRVELVFFLITGRLIGEGSQLEKITLHVAIPHQSTHRGWNGMVFISTYYQVFRGHAVSFLLHFLPSCNHTWNHSALQN